MTVVQYPTVHRCLRQPKNDAHVIGASTSVPTESSVITSCGRLDLRALGTEASASS